VASLTPEINISIINKYMYVYIYIYIYVYIYIYLYVYIYAAIECSPSVDC